MVYFFLWLMSATPGEVGRSGGGRGGVGMGAVASGGVGTEWLEGL